MGVGAVASAAGTVSSAAAGKKAEAKAYKRQLHIRRIEWDRSRAEYAHNVTRAEEQLDENFMAASRGYGAEQQQLNALFDQASVSLQSDFIKMAKQGKFYGTGKTADRLAAQDLAAFGRAQALTSSNLVRGMDSFQNDVAAIRSKLKAANRRTLAPVEFKPIPGLKPVRPNMDITPALLQAGGQLAQGAVGTYNQGKEMELWGKK